MLYSRVLSDLLGGPVYLKCENLQRTGSFKVRGAYARIARLSAAERARGVVAASAGNHAQGVAFASGLLGTRATVVMPSRAPIPKVQATRAYGASVLLHGDSVEDALSEALRLAAADGSVFIHPFDHADVIAGQGTLGYEIVEQCPQARTILVPSGGGGLAAGVAVAAKSLDPGIRVVGVQAAEVAPYPLSLAAGHPVPVDGGPTIADGIAVRRPGDIAYGILSALGDGFLTVSEAELSRALLLCLERAKQVVEPAGAAAVAALLSAAGSAAGSVAKPAGSPAKPPAGPSAKPPAGSVAGPPAEPSAKPPIEPPAEPSIEPPVVAVLSGGNIDPLLLSKLLRHGLSADGRYLGFRCRLPDHPGSLAELLGFLAGLGANVIEVSHDRLGPSLRVGEVEVVLQVETRGPEHCADVKGKLKAVGYALDFG
ncbi:MAG: threonine ammonia-lyase [Nocardiopsaceae bacterium]|nr:threonine ammonia-lyase [Nocardiopsaceae bacterium]